MVHQKSALSEMEKMGLTVKTEPTELMVKTEKMVFHQKLLLKRTQQIMMEILEPESR
ncbi:hypothetical protein [Dolosigranulum pigrum]|uniref:hypothetical protein n=1 Tax=Dolosigranulum pigrum TaxID=29394 RepID=UPI00155E0093|nr:hypothetical protein [Dolosigranulum pigrum]